MKGLVQMQEARGLQNVCVWGGGGRGGGVLRSGTGHSTAGGEEELKSC